MMRTRKAKHYSVTAGLFAQVLLLSSCGSLEPNPGQTFLFGWVLLGLLILAMLVLFVSLIRYVKGGTTVGAQAPEPTEFVYDASEEEEEEEEEDR